ncbi:ERCC4 domain-containing protein [Nostocoides australiense]|uniref:Uncharacterized protein n=1 Tax=Nostocoides australiense Ben110 TaxID=1193182 RepID=W6JU10_9MICO|nr:ERCC4 domain-containing protein [Tetrasphaera australiensis]CCH71920.1 hypothetical protein BN11_120023 [Tetrasphaera australiensis Ben110]HPF79588.1 ERCC4 domain-containing protein [Tetrasphaera australiensis]
MSLPHAAVVVEDRYSSIFKLTHIRPAMVADMLAELQVQFATVPIVFAENRALAQEWTYRFLGAAADESRSREARQGGGSGVELVSIVQHRTVTIQRT